MSLRLRLALSYLVVVVLFLVTLGVCHALLTIPAANHFRDESMASWRTRWQLQLNQAYQRGGWDELAREAESMELPPNASVTLSVPGQAERQLETRHNHGPPDHPPPPEGIS